MVSNIYTINRDLLLSTITLAKNLKADYIYIKDNMIYGTDSGFNILKVLQIDYQFPISIIVLMGEMANFIKELDWSVVEFKVYEEIIHNKYINHNGYILSVYDIDLARRFESMIINVNNMVSSIAPIEYANIKTNYQEFNNYIGMKTGEGAKIFNINQYTMSIYGSLLPINKADKVDLTIRGIDDKKFLSEYIIYKKDKITKSNIIIRVFILHLYL